VGNLEGIRLPGLFEGKGQHIWVPFLDSEDIKILGNVVLRRKPQSTFCAIVRLWLRSDIHGTYLGFFFLDPEDIRKLSIGVIWNFAKGTEFL
jgi:hypothetical protein